MADLLIEHLGKTYEGGVAALSDVTLRIADGELFALLGPSGCGKTTLLRLIAGLERPTTGRIAIDGRDVAGVAAHERGVALVFQDAALYPHLTAGANMAFPLKVAREPADAIEDHVGDIAGLLGIEHLLERMPSELAAGHRQGVATGRALLGARSVVLMDEPMANLDAGARSKLHDDLLGLKRSGRCTIVYVTNDQSEAMALADRIAVIDRGRIQQIAEPRLLYRHPANLMVAGFLGSPPMNIAAADVAVDRSGLTVAIGSRVLRIEPDQLVQRPDLTSCAGRTMLVGIRPEDLRYGRTSSHGGAEQRLGGEVLATEFLGRTVHLHFALDAMAPDGSHGVEFVAMLPGDVSIERGSHIGLAVDVGRLHFFDPDSGQAVAAVTAPGTSS